MWLTNAISDKLISSFPLFFFFIALYSLVRQAASHGNPVSFLYLCTLHFGCDSRYAESQNIRLIPLSNRTSPPRSSAQPIPHIRYPPRRTFHCHHHCASAFHYHNSQVASSQTQIYKTRFSSHTFLLHWHHNGISRCKYVNLINTMCFFQKTEISRIFRVCSCCLESYLLVAFT